MTELLSARDAIEHAIDQLTADRYDREAIALAHAWATIANVLFKMEQADYSSWEDRMASRAMDDTMRDYAFE